MKSEVVATTIVVVVSLWCGYLIGQVQHAEKVAPRIARLEQEVVHARRLAANCHRMVADHWSSLHLVVPGSAETVITSRLLIEDLEEGRRTNAAR